MAFTLIELLIVVAIIGILAAIAVPNFRNAMIRANIAKVKGDFKAIETALETYFIDHSRYPGLFFNFGVSYGNGKLYLFDSIIGDGIHSLTSPIAYISSDFPKIDPFGKNILINENKRIDLTYRYKSKDVSFIQLQKKGYHEWILCSIGPDTYTGGFPDRLNKDTVQVSIYPIFTHIYQYDISNGLISNGDIYAFSGGVPSPYAAIDDKPPKLNFK